MVKFTVNDLSNRYIRFQFGLIIGIFGGLLMLISPCLPWVEWKFRTITFHRDGFSFDDFYGGGILVALAGLIVVFNIVETTYIKPSNPYVKGTLKGAAIGLIVLAFEFWRVADLIIQFKHYDSRVGIGYIVGVLGGFLAFISYKIQEKYEMKIGHIKNKMTLFGLILFLIVLFFSIFNIFLRTFKIAILLCFILISASLYITKANLDRFDNIVLSDK